MRKRKPISHTEARQLGDALGISWRSFDVEEFRLGLEAEVEQATWDSGANIAFDDAFVTGKLAWSRLNQIPNYYSSRKAAEEESDAYWANT